MKKQVSRDIVYRNSEVLTISRQKKHIERLVIRRKVRRNGRQVRIDGGIPSVRGASCHHVRRWRTRLSRPLLLTRVHVQKLKVSRKLKPEVPYLADVMIYLRKSHETSTRRCSWNQRAGPQSGASNGGRNWRAFGCEPMGRGQIERGGREWGLPAAANAEADPSAMGPLFVAVSQLLVNKGH